MDINPVVWRCVWLDAHGDVSWSQYHSLDNPMPGMWDDAPDLITCFYDQSAIDALTSEVERLNACLEVQTENALVLIGMKELADAEADRLRQELAAIKGEG